MFDTPTPSLVYKEPFRHILERVALPLMLFSAVLFVLLFVSWFGILPRFTRFALADVTVSPIEMASYVSHMKAELSTMEEKRNRLVLPLNNPSYDALKQDKKLGMDALDIQTRLLGVATGLINADRAVMIERVSVDNATQTVSVSGDIRNVGPRSMTVLASYVELVEGLPFVDHLVRPSFTRVQDESGDIHSPFSLKFTLKPSAQ